MSTVRERVARAAEAGLTLRNLDNEARNAGLEAIATVLAAKQDEVAQANAQDLSGARESGL
ncbi:MAG TPA: hypothetical protein VJ932_06325, partial [Alkalispirochaeta sp.]|nr:hypothetical protein [Alkalispirochaeta sp.]